ncbi:hypothetical protein ABTL40_19665, partial [Acinetobacter baumannii]
YSNRTIWRFLQFNIGEETNREYVEKYVAIDIRSPLIIAYQGPGMWSDVAHIDEATRKSHPIYQEYFLKNGMTESLSALVGQEGN